MWVGPGLGRPAWLLSGGAGQSFFLGRSDQVWAAGMWRVTPHQPQVWRFVAPPQCHLDPWPFIFSVLILNLRAAVRAEPGKAVGSEGLRGWGSQKL